MKLFDVDALKKNYKCILIMLLLITLIVIIDMLMHNSTNDNQELNNDSIKVNALVINEIMSSNEGAYADENGKLYDWIELYNGTSEDIDLTNYGLSDVNSGEIKWKFPNVTIKSKEYLVIYLTGKTNSGLYANFALGRKGGELITLKNASGKVVDSVRTVGLDKNAVMARVNNKWIETFDITPGFSNNEDGREAFLESINRQDDSLVINEFLPSNKGNILFEDGLNSYVEVMNTTNETINLGSYSLSNDKKKPFLWNLPDIELKPKEVYLLKTDDHFKLTNKNGTLILSKSGRIVEEVNYQDLVNGYAYVKIDNTFIETTNISPGYVNTSEGVKAFNKEVRVNKKGLIINEVMNRNNSYLVQNGNKYYDWIELYNNTDSKISLKEYYLTTDTSSKKMYNLPDVELGAYEYYIVMASGNTKYSNKEYQHTNFKLSSTESLYLYHDSKLEDAIMIADIPINYSFGRGKDNGLYYFSKPTPNKENGDGILEIAYTPKFSVAPGVYDDKKSMTLKLNGTGTIYYTLDGSMPTKQSKIYNSPIILDKTTVVKAINYEDGKKSSEVVTGTYFVNEKHTIPVLSISLADSDFTSLNRNLSSTTYTVKAHAELYEKDSSFSIDCGIKLFGGQTRYISKKSFALKFSSKYGESTLDYKVFDNRDAVNYDTLVVRSGSQDSVGAMFRDELATSIMDEYGTVDVQSYKPVILYINGRYWGVYFLREKVNEEFVSHHYNVDPNDTNIIRVDNDLSAGSSHFYNSIRNYIQNHNMQSDEHYEYISNKIDIDNFIDFWIGEIYTTNNDIVNMRFFNNPNVDNGKMKMIFYDFDYAFYNYSINYLNWMTQSSGLGEKNYDNTILRGLMQNNKFKKRFVERLSYNMKNVWSEKNIDNKYNELYNMLKPEMQRNQERWGLTYSQWEDNCKELKNYLEKRREYILNHTKSYFGLSSKEMKDYFE